MLRRLLCACRLVVVSDHDGSRRPRANYSAIVVKHREMDIEPGLLAVVPAVAGYSQGKDS